MKRKHSFFQAGVAGADYRPDRVRRLMRAIKSALDLQYQRALSYEELGRLCGQAGSTAHDRLHKRRQAQVEALIAWMERLPVSSRHQFIDSACRCYPTIEAERISHDPTQLSQLKRLLQQPTGLTVIQSGSAAARTFLATALGHSYTIQSDQRGIVRGIDAHEPDWFVPLPDVIYLCPGASERAWKESVIRIWKSISRRSHHGLVVLNGVWRALEPVRSELEDYSLKAHLVLADDLRFEKQAVTELVHGSVRILNISEDKDNRLEIAMN